MLKLRLKIWKQTIKEWALHDSQVVRPILGNAMYVLGMVFLRVGKADKGARTLASAHRSALSRRVDARIESLFREALNSPTTRSGKTLALAINRYHMLPLESENARKIASAPESLFDGHAIVLKSPGPNEKGVIYFFYSYTYPLFLRLYRAEEIAERYRIVLEPSWSGFCDLNILCLNQLGEKIVVGYGERRDAQLLQHVSSQFIPCDFTGNTWIDTHTFCPLAGARKDIDLIVNAAWAWYKRHWAIFKVLSKLKDRGIILRTALVGYPADMKLDEVKRLASLFGVVDQIEFHERITTKEVNALYNRSRISLLWSRREGSGRALPEGMAAGVPCISRQGFNYGEPQAFVNELSGKYSSEAQLPDTLVEMLKDVDRYQPRAWVVENMTPEVSTSKLNALLKSIAENSGEDWRCDIAIKISTLNGLEYSIADEADRFSADYTFLRSMKHPEISL